MRPTEKINLDICNTVRQSQVQERDESELRNKDKGKAEGGECRSQKVIEKGEGGCDHWSEEGQWIR